MNHRINQIAERRIALINKAAAQRASLDEAFEPIRTSLTLADKGLMGFRYLANHPVVLASAVALAVAVLPKRWLFVMESGWAAWRMALAAKRNLDG